MLFIRQQWFFGFSFFSCLWLSAETLAFEELTDEVHVSTNIARPSASAKMLSFIDLPIEVQKIILQLSDNLAARLVCKQFSKLNITKLWLSFYNAEEFNTFYQGIKYDWHYQNLSGLQLGMMPTAINIDATSLTYFAQTPLSLFIGSREFQTLITDAAQKVPYTKRIIGLKLYSDDGNYPENFPVRQLDRLPELLPQLILLDVSDACTTIPVMQTVCNGLFALKTLSIRRLSYYRLSIEENIDLSQHPALETLKLEHIFRQETDLLERLRNITRLEIENSDKCVINSVKNLTQLEILKLFNLKWYDLSSLEKLQSLINLKHLELHSIKEKNHHYEDYSWLGKLTQLETLTLSNLNQASDAGWLIELENLKKLTWLNTKIHDDNIIVELSKSINVEYQYNN